jgi:hypothetical protein
LVGGLTNVIGLRPSVDSGLPISLLQPLTGQYLQSSFENDSWNSNDVDEPPRFTEVSSINKTEQLFCLTSIVFAGKHLRSQDSIEELP